MVFDFTGNAVYTNPGCQAPIVPISVTLSPDSVTVTPGTIVNVSAVINSGNYISYFWSGGIGSFGNTGLLNTTYQTDNLFTGTEFLLFGIVNSCHDTLYDTIVVQISNTSSGIIELMNSQIWVPNVFMPDDNTHNNYFNIKSSYSDLSVYGIIYNILGEEIAKWNSLDKGWDGKTKAGRNVPDGIYYYVIRISFANREFRKLSGPLILLR